MQIIRGRDIQFVPASHEDAQNPGVLKRVLATKKDLLSGQVQMVNWSRLPVNSGFQAHYHEDMQETFILLNGQVAMTVDGQTHVLNEGDAILIQPREVHEMKNLSDEDVQYIVFGISTERGGRTVIVNR